MFTFIGPIIILFLLLPNVIVFYLNGEGCCVLGPRLPPGRALERLSIGLGTTSRVGEIKPLSKVESVVIFHYLLTRSVITLITAVRVDQSKFLCSDNTMNTACRPQTVRYSFNLLQCR